MKLIRNGFRAVATALMVIIIVAVGYNIVLKSLYPEKYTDHINKYCEEYNVDAPLVYAIIKCESNFKSDAVSSAKAVGLMQLTEKTFNDVSVMLGEETAANFSKDALDPETNIKYGVRYLQYLYTIFEQDTVAVVAAYNAGLGNVKKWKNGDEKLSTSKIEFE